MTITMNDLTRVTTTERDVAERVDYDLGAVDKYGRRIGCYTRFLVEAFVPATEYAPNDGGCWVRHERVGTWYAMDLGATRDGHGYGAYQSRRYFATERELVSAAAKYVADARKRAHKTGTPDLFPSTEVAA